MKGGAWQLLSIIAVRLSDCFLSLTSPVAPLNFKYVSTALIAPTAVAAMGIIPATPAEGYVRIKHCKKDPLFLLEECYLTYP